MSIVPENITEAFSFLFSPKLIDAGSYPSHFDGSNTLHTHYYPRFTCKHAAEVE